MVDIDGPQFRSESYDPSYGWSIWTNERKLEVEERSIKEWALRMYSIILLMCNQNVI